MRRFLFLFLAACQATPLVCHALEVTNLRCEYLKDPLGIDEAKPRLSWQTVISDQLPVISNLRQVAHRVLVASTPELLAKDQGDLWDSGKVESDQSIQVEYGGPSTSLRASEPLESRMRCYWKVRTWFTVQGSAVQGSEWSQPASWTMGMLRPEDWQAKWIGLDRSKSERGLSLESAQWIWFPEGAPASGAQAGTCYFRRAFTLPPDRKIVKATIQMTADNAFELTVNGKQAGQGDDWNRPVTLDLAGSLQGGTNILAIAATNAGDAPSPAGLIGVLAVEFAEGEPFLLCTDAKWKCRREQAEGWDTAGLDDSQWPAAKALGGFGMAPWGQSIGTDPKHAAVYLRKDVAVEKPVVRALVHFCGLGFSELAIDGKKVGDYVIGPGFTTYNKRTQYLAFDVTERFKKPGAHQLDVTLADGWYGLSHDPWVHGFENNPYVDKPKLLLNLHLQHSDGTETVIVSDASWKWSLGEITRSWIVQEDIDLRQQTRDWKPVAVVKGPEGRLVCQKEPPNRIVNEAKPVSFKYDAATKSATWDFGREINGWVRFRASGPAGTRLTITTEAVGGGKGTGAPGFPPRSSTFILGAAQGSQTYEPRFFHGGMRHVTVTGLAEAPKQDDLIGCEISSLYTPSGDFKCSDERLTWLHDCVRRTMVAYTTFLPNDPVREWKAWTQDIEGMFWSALYLFDSRAMYRRWEYDFLDTQEASGNFPSVTPGPDSGNDYNSPWWGGCGVWLPWEWYQYYGDDSLLREAYPAMKRYVDYLDKVAKDGLQQWGLTDWYAVEETPVALINTPAHVHYADVVSRTATMLGKTNEAQQYAAIAARLRQALNQKFLDPATGIYGQSGWKVAPGQYVVLPKPLDQLHSDWWTGDRPCTQAGQALALAMDIPPKEVRGQVLQALLKEIEAHHGRLSTGFVATPYLLRVLRDLAPDAGWRMTTTGEFPSWLNMTRGSGSDVMKETWNGGAALMPSLGGNIAAWNMEALAGIRPDPAGPGFKKIIIKPAIVGDLKWVNAHHDSPYGRIVSNWKCEGQKLTMDVAIPPNTTATVYVPAKDEAGVTESGKPASKSAAAKFLRMEDGAAVFEVGSGVYRFQSSLAETLK